MLTRRTFLGYLPSIAACAAVPSITTAQSSANVGAQRELYAALSPKGLAKEEGFWNSVRKEFTVTDRFIHLENGYYTLRSNSLLESQIEAIRRINTVSSHYMRREMAQDRVHIKQLLAKFSGVKTSEIALLRNTTEALNTVIAGYPSEPGDEFIYADQDYGSMVEAFELKAKRFGTVNRVVSIPNHPRSDEEIVRTYTDAITPRTRAIHVTHMINLTGQVLPVRKIAQAAHKMGVEVICDGAHSFGHLDFNIPDLECDYFATSLHKWLGAPLGTGLLWVEEDKIPKLWPLMGNVSKDPDSIEKLEQIGTHSPSSILAIEDALQFHNSIGSANKEARLRYLRKYWMDRVSETPGLHINSPGEWDRSGAIGNVTIEGLDPTSLANSLYERFGIFTVAISNPQAAGVRITPHLFTSINDLNALVEALNELAMA